MNDTCRPQRLQLFEAARGQAEKRQGETAMIRTWLTGAAAALALGLVAASAEAAPATGAATDLKAAAGESSVVENTHWGRRRHKYYHSYDVPYWRYYSYYPRHRYYYGYAPGFRFYYGGPRRYHRRWHDHW
jgi:hypothetical protein